MHDWNYGIYIREKWERRLKRWSIKSLTWHGFYPGGNWTLENSKEQGPFASMLSIPRVLLPHPNFLSSFFFLGGGEKWEFFFSVRFTKLFIVPIFSFCLPASGEPVKSNKTAYKIRLLTT